MHAAPFVEAPVNILYVIPVFILGFTFMWLFVTGLISFVGGWYSLAKTHPAPERSLGRGAEYSFQSVRIGLMGNYRTCVNVTVLGEGLLLCPIVLYRFLHRPIFLPWDRMANHREANIFFMKRISFTAGGKKIVIGGRSAEDIWKKVKGGC